MKPENLYKRVTKAESTLTEAVEIAEEQRKALIQSHRTAIKKKVKENIEETPVMREARENIERLQLRLELLRNIKMNWRSFQGSLTKKGMKMRINQHAHLDHLIAFLETGRGVSIAACDEVDLKPDPSRALMAHEVQPTGAGKTGAFAIDVALMDVPSLTLVPFDSLLDQTKKDMIKIGDLSEDQIGIVGGGSKEFGRKHTIATYAGHAAQMRKGGDYAKFMKTQCKLVICDEVHHQALGDRMQESIREIETLSNGAPTDEEVEMLESEKEVITHLSEQMGIKSLMIGFTATPRGSRKHVQQYFPHCIGRVYHHEMVEAGLVVPYKIIQCDGSVFAGELDEYLTQEKEAEILEREGIYKKLIGEYADVLGTYRTVKHKVSEMPLRGMAFCSSHIECEKLAEEAEQHGLKSRIVTGREARGRAGQVVINEAVDLLIKGDIDLIVTVEKLATGFNREEINGIVSARITSAAKTIQYIGRGARSHTDSEGRVKEDCLVFETNWTLKKNGKRGKKPLRLADALAFNGEDPEAICSMADGSILQVERTHQLANDGTVDIGGRLAVGLNAYHHGSNLDVSVSTLRNLVQENLKPIPDTKVSLPESMPVDAYWKDEIDALIPKKLKDVIVMVDDKEAVALGAYAQSLNLEIKPKTLEKYLLDAGYCCIPNKTIIYGSQTVELFWKDEVDKVIPKEPNDKGIVDIGGRSAVNIPEYAKALQPSMSPNTLKQYVSNAKLLPVSNAKVRSGNIDISVYWKDEVDLLLPKKLNGFGIVPIGNRQAVGITLYGKNLKPRISNQILQGYVNNASLNPIPNANVFSGNRPVDVYWKDEVDAAIPKKLNALGTVTINGREAVGISAYGLSQEPSIQYVTLESWINAADLKKIENVEVLSGPRSINVYWKDEVDEILRQKGRL